MDALTLFGLFAVSAMLICYALENRSHWYVLLFAVSRALGLAYGFLQGAWPFGLVEAIWSIVALRRWLVVRKSCNMHHWKCLVTGTALTRSDDRHERKADTFTHRLYQIRAATEQTAGHCRREREERVRWANSSLPVRSGRWAQ